MTTPAASPTQPKSPTVTGGAAKPASGSASGWAASAAPAPPDHRTTALESAVSVLRGGKPAASTQDVLAMAEEFYQFLRKGNQGNLS